MSYHQRDEIRWNKKGYYERFDGKKYWRKLCIIEGCMKRAKVLSWCKRHYTEEKQKSGTNQTQTQQQSSTPASTTVTNSTSSSNLLFHQPHYHQLQAISQIPLPPPSFLYTSTSMSSSPASDQSNSLHVRNEIRVNKRGYREQFDGVGHWRPLCVWAQCSKRAKKSAYCKRHYTEQMGHDHLHPNLNEIKKSM